MCSNTGPDPAPPRMQANHGQEISDVSQAPRTHLLGLRPLLPDRRDELRQRLRPHHAPHRTPWRRLGKRGGLGIRRHR
ncbi:hypothetical protein G6F22_021638 [Rhizopus arrhizus]|nr:hypothetical protein G6F22_021638 [Rhizopus arrhizus]